MREFIFDENFLSHTNKGAASNVSTYSGVKIELRGNSTRNHIHIQGTRHFYMSECKVAQSSAFSIEATDQSEENDVLLHGILLLGDLRPNVYRRGLQVIITQWARKNAIQVSNLTSIFHKAIWGAGGYIEFSGHAMENSVQIKDTYFILNYALKGGGIAVVYRTLLLRTHSRQTERIFLSALQNWVVESISSFRIPQEITPFNSHR